MRLDREREDEIGSLHHRVSALEKRYDTAMVSCREMKKEYEKAEMNIKRRDEQIISLRQSLQEDELKALCS